MLETSIIYVSVVDDALFVALIRNCYSLMCMVIRKVFDRYSGTVVGVMTSSRNGWRRCCCGRQW